MKKISNIKVAPVAKMLDGGDDEDADPLAPRPLWETVLKFTLILVVIGGLAYAISAIRMGNAVTESLSGPLRDAGEFLCVALILALLFALGMITVGLFAKGRLVLYRASRWWLSKITTLSLFCMSITYMPVMNTLLAAWSCQSHPCPTGYVYPNKDLRLDTSAAHALRATDVCVPCAFDTLCPSDLSQRLCSNPESERSRLYVDPTLSCHRHILYYFTPASVVMVVGFNLVQLFFYFRMINRGVGKSLELDLSEIPYVKQDQMSVESRYSTAVGLTHTHARHLYRNIAYKQRYMNAVLMLEMTFCVGLAVLLRSPLIALILMMVVHVAHFGYHAVTLFYMRPLDNAVALALRFNLILDAAFSIAIERVGASKVPMGAVIVILILNCVIPLAAAAVGVLYERRVAELVRRGLEGDESVFIQAASKKRHLYALLRALSIQFLQTRRANVNKFRSAFSRDRMAERRAEADKAAGSLPPLPDLKPKDGAAADGGESGSGGGSGGGGGDGGKDRRTAAQVDDSIDPDVEAAARAKFPDSLVDSVDQLNKGLNRYAAISITFFFIVSSIFVFVGFAFVLIGIVRGSTTSSFIPQQPFSDKNTLEFITNHDFATYPSWPDMLSNCCCSRGSPTFKYDDVEYWQCDNGFTKMKARTATLVGTDIARYSAARHSGLNIRGFCERSFVSGVCKEPFYERPVDTDPVVRVDFDFYRQDVCSADNFHSEKGVSTYSFHRLW